MNIRNVYKYCLESLSNANGFSKFVVTTDSEIKSNGFNLFSHIATYIRGAGGIVHWTRGLSLFPVASGFFIPITSNNDK